MLDDYLFTLDVARRALPGDADHVHGERRKLARELPALFAARDTVAAQRPIPLPLDIVLPQPPSGVTALEPPRIVSGSPGRELPSAALGG